MKKTILITISIFFLCIFFCSCLGKSEEEQGGGSCYEESSEVNTEICKNKEINKNDEREKDASYCCYMEYVDMKTNMPFKGCYPISEDDYEDVDKAIELALQYEIMNVTTCDCKSSYLQLGIIGLIALLL